MFPTGFPVLTYRIGLTDPKSLTDLPGRTCPTDLTGPTCRTGFPVLTYRIGLTGPKNLTDPTYRIGLTDPKSPIVLTCPKNLNPKNRIGLTCLKNLSLKRPIVLTFPKNLSLTILNRKYRIVRPVPG
jgi:hypothetical protein